MQSCGMPAHACTMGAAHACTMDACALPPIRMRIAPALHAFIRAVLHVSRLQAEVRVYEADGDRFRCISRFGSSGSAGSRAKVVTLLYSGRVHYDALAALGS